MLCRLPPLSRHARVQSCGRRQPNKFASTGDRRRYRQACQFRHKETEFGSVRCYPPGPKLEVGRDIIRGRAKPMNTSRMCRSICSSLSAAWAAWVISTTAEDDYRYAAEARCMLMLILSTCALALLRTEHRQPETAFWAILWSWSILWNMYATPSRWFRPAVLLWLMVTCASACSNARLARVHAGLRSWLAYMVTLPCAPAVLALTMTWKSEAAQALARCFPMFGFQSADQGNHIGSGRSPARPAQSTARSSSLAEHLRSQPKW